MMIVASQPLEHDGPNENDSRGSTTLSQAAIMYVEHGVAIFPVRPQAKQPALPRCPDAVTDDGHKLTGQALAEHAADCPNDGHGFHDATTDLDTIRRWWNDIPNANIGIALGTNGIFAVDVDGPAGRATLDDLEATYQPLPDTYEVITGRPEGHGRHHIYWQPQDGHPVGNGRLGTDLETRGDGGYIIAPPSIHESGRPYLAEGSWSQITNPPDWLVALATKPDTPTTPTPTVNPDSDELARKRLTAMAGRVAIAPEGDRNNQLNWAAYTAGRLVGAGWLDRTHVEQVLTVAAQRAGLDPHEVAATIASGIDGGIQDPDHDQPTSSYTTPPTTVLDGPQDGDDRTILEMYRNTSEFQQLVSEQIARQLARQDARDKIAAAETALEPPPPLIRLDDFLAQPDSDITYRIEGLWPSDGRCLLAAQYKAGKTTTVGNILRSLADNRPLFDKFNVTPPNGRIVLIDDELHENTLRRWLRDQNIDNDHLIDVVALRGRLTTFNILDDTVRELWAERLREADASIVILDCLRPLIDVLGLSEDKDTGRVLTAFDELLELGGASEGLIVHHMGHARERSRGDSRLRDWPDAEWKIVRGDEDEDDATAPRFFSAIGRDVDVHEQQIALDEDGRHLYIAGGSRQAMKEWDTIRKIVQVVIDNPGIALRDIPAEVRQLGGKGRTEKLVDLAKLAEVEGFISLEGDGATPRVPTVPHERGNRGTPPVTVVDNSTVPAVPHPPGNGRSRTPKGDSGNAPDRELWGTDDDDPEVPL